MMDTFNSEIKMSILQLKDSRTATKLNISEIMRQPKS